MTARALLEVSLLTRRSFSRIGSETRRPRDIVRIHINHAGARIHGGPAPFSAAVEPGEEHGLLADHQRDELPGALKVSELFHCPLAHLGRPGGEQVFCESLSGKWGWSQWKRLRR